MDMMEYLPEKDSAVWRAIMTFLQTLAGFIIGLIITVWNVPHVPEAIVAYVSNNLGTFMVVVGLPAGFASLIINIIRPSVKNV